MRRTWRWLVVCALVAGLVPLLPLGVVVADDAVVAAPCGEAQFDAALALAQTNGGGTITFACGGPTTIPFTSQKTITSPNTVIIDGGGLITFDGGDATRLFVVNFGASLELVGVTLQNGNAGDDNGGAIVIAGVLTVTASTFSANSAGNQGGAIYSLGGTLEITSSTFSGNSASAGGAISSQGMLEITSSTFSANSATDSGGAIFTVSVATITASTFRSNSAFVGGAISNTVTLEIMVSTFSANSASFLGGAISNTDVLEVTSSTFSGNSASAGGAISNSATVSLQTTILADSPSGGNCVAPFGGITSLGSNLSDDASCNLTATGDIPNSTSINLGPLANNGGPTLTHLPGTGSDAIDNGPATCASPDQRGLPRPSGPACDIGSVEVQISSSTFALCVDRYTGRVLSPLNGPCKPGQVALEAAAVASLAFCIDPYTGIVHYTFGRPCTPPRQTHVVPTNGDLLTCVNVYTSVNRRVFNHSQCLPSERANTISATP